MVVRSGFERAVAESLKLHGYAEFLPLCRPLPRFANGRRPNEEAGRVLSPGYVFARYRPWPAPRIVEIPGVSRLVSFDNRIAVIPS